MSEFNISNMFQLSSYVLTLDTQGGQLKNYAKSVRQVSSQLKTSHFSNVDVSNALESIAISLDDNSKDEDSLSELLQNIIKMYQQCETAIISEKSFEYEPAETSPEDTEKEQEQSFWDKILESLKSETGLVWLLPSALIDNTANRLEGLINIIRSWGRSEGANAFVIIDPAVAAKTSAMYKTVSKGLVIFGAALDFYIMQKTQDIEDAAIKAGAHLAIGLGGAAAGAKVGAIVGSVVPGAGTAAGTAVGAVVGFVVGTGISVAGNCAFDSIYDKYIEGEVEKAKDAVVGFVDGVGNAFKSGFQSIGTVFG